MAQVHQNHWHLQTKPITTSCVVACSRDSHETSTSAYRFIRKSHKTNRAAQFGSPETEVSSVNGKQTKVA